MAGRSAGVDGVSVEDDETEWAATEAGDEGGMRPTLPGSAVGASWQPGDVVVGRYEVLGVLGKGGMGEVLQVRHREWDVEMAVKAPLPRLLLRSGGFDDFVREAQTWVGLGAHPHVVSCYFVRQIDGLPRVFAEYVPGGSLADWLAAERPRLRRVLDVAIQMSWGLAHAHAAGLVHQDVKPANVMMTPTGVAKLTDFGLARARSLADGTVAATGACTPMYAAPEQLEHRPLTTACDVFAWAVTVVEMLVGSAGWSLGPGAPEVWRAHLAETASEPWPVPPVGLVALLDRCLEADPAARPGFGEVEAALREVWEAWAGRPYPRRPPGAAGSRADGLNNRAVSMLELGDEASAAALLGEALTADRHHLRATYNLGLLRWRTGVADDEAALRALEAAGRSGTDDQELALLTGWLHVERGDASGARAALERVDAPRLAEEAGRARAALRQGHSMGCETSLGFGAGTAVAMGGGQVFCAAGLDVHVFSLEGLAPRGGLEAHGNLVADVAVTPDGLRCATASHDRTACLWVHGACTRTLVGHDDQVRAVAVSADGETVVTGGRDATVRVWSGRAAVTLGTHGSAVLAVAVSADGAWAVSGGQDHRLRLWNVAEARCERQLPGHDAAVSAVFIDEARVVSAGWDRVVRVWPRRGGEAEVVLGHTSPVLALAVVGDRVCGAGADGEVRVWDARSGRLVRRFEAHAGEVSGVALSADGDTLVTVGADGKLRSWRLEPTARAAPHLVIRPRAAEDLVAHQAAFADALAEAREALETGDADAALTPLRRARGLPGYSRASEAVALWRAVGAELGRGELVDAWPLSAYAHGRPVESVAIAGERVASAAWDGSVWVDGEPLRCHEEAATAVCFDGDEVVSASAEGEVGGLRLPSAECLAIRAGRRLVGLADGRLSLDGRLWRAHDGPVTAVAFLPDGGLVSAGRDGLAQLYDEAGGKSGQRRVPGGGPVLSLAVTDEGEVLYGTCDGVLRTWGGREIPAHEDAIHGIAVAGRTVATVSSDGHLCLWDLPTGRSLRRIRVDDHPLSSVALSADAQRAVTGGSRVTLWALDWDLGAG